MIPKRNAAGELPPGIHETTLDEIEAVFAHTSHRHLLFDGLKRAVANLQVAGVHEVFIDGSFTTDKPAPNDVDGCWRWHEAVDLTKLDTVFLDFSQQRSAMKRKFGVDFFIADWVESGSGITFVEFFQRNRYDEPKGILMIDVRKMS